MIASGVPLRRLFAGKVVFEGSEQVPDDRNAPGPAQELLPGAATHVGHVGVVDREAEDPVGGGREVRLRPVRHTASGAPPSEAHGQWGSAQ